jgi:hypothetical protein
MELKRGDFGLINWKKANHYFSFVCLFGAIVYVAYKEIPKRHPKLDRSDLVGCWHSKEIPYFMCYEECFEKSGGYYRKGIALNPPGNVGEILGSFSIADKNAVQTEFYANTSNGQRQTELTIESELRAIKDGKLFNFHQKSGNIFENPLERSTKEKNCGRHWMTIKKPDNWSLGDFLDIKI